MIYGLAGAACGAGIGYLILDTTGAVGGGVFGGVIGFLSGAIMRVAAKADAIEVEALAENEEDEYKAATSEQAKKKKSQSV